MEDARATRGVPKPPPALRLLGPQGWAAAFAAGAALLIHVGAADLLRSALALTPWQFDEILFVLLAGAVGAFAASHFAQRTARRSEAEWAAEQDRAHDLACRDPLTGLFNRRGLDLVAGRAPAADRSRLLLLVDLDDFKSINDTHGHRAGDDVLRGFAERLKPPHGLPADLVAIRTGGDEFVLVVSAGPDDDEAAMFDALLRPLQTVGPDRTPFQATVSAGLTRWSADMPLETALEQADIAMYEAKRAGMALRRYDSRSDEAGSSPRRLKRLFERELSGLPDRGAPIFVAALSIDRYYAAKRALGHGYAAQILRGLRESLHENRPGLLIERIAPDALAVLFAAADIDEATTIVEGFSDLCARFPAADAAATEELTVGLAGPAPAGGLRETVEQALGALEEARRLGSRRVVFDLVEQGRADHNLSLMSDLRQAIATDQLELHYQPKMTSRTGEIDSFEALVRWTHPQHGAVSPAMFVPVAEASGDIEAMTYWVIRRAIRDWEALNAAGIARTIYVNVSAQLVGVPAFADRLLAKLGGQAGRIGMEITETAVLDNPDHALRHLRQIAAAGIPIAIDDYGVGLSSLSYLKQLPATELKIDMSFITHLADSHRDPMIVRSTIDLAHGLGLRVTAEGVDKPDVLTLLKIMGCDMIQGYQIAAAMPVDQLILFMRDYDCLTEHVPDCATQFLALVSV